MRGPQTKKKLESDINELEVALDQANRARAEAEKQAKKYAPAGPAALKLE